MDLLVETNTYFWPKCMQTNVTAPKFMQFKSLNVEKWDLNPEN